MIKHLLHHFLFLGTMFAAGAPAVGGGNDTGAGSGNAAPVNPSPSNAGTGQGQPASGPAPGQQPTIDWNTAPHQLREAFNTQKRVFEELQAKHAPWEKLNLQPEQVSQYQTVYQKTYDEIAILGRELGYPDDQIAEALAENPIATLDFLRNQAAQAADQRQQPGPQDLEELVNQRIEQAIQPFQERQNTEQTNTANALFERTIHKMAVDAFKAEGISDVAQIPQDELTLLMDAASELMKYDQQALKELKFEGKTASIQKYFQEAKNLLDKYYLSRSGREAARIQPARPGQPVAPKQQPGKRPSLDEIIENPAVLGKQYA